MLFGMVHPSEQRHTIWKTVGRFKDLKALSVSQVSNQERRMFGSRWTINKQTNKLFNYCRIEERFLERSDLQKSVILLILKTVGVLKAFHK